MDSGREPDREDRRWERIEEEIRLTREEIRLSREQRAESDARYRELQLDMRNFMRDQTRRIERIAEAWVRRTDDLIDESRAQRQALLRILDRLDGPGDSPATA